LNKVVPLHSKLVYLHIKNPLYRSLIDVFDSIIAQMRQQLVAPVAVRLIPFGSLCDPTVVIRPSLILRFLVILAVEEL
jgi:hypothetical protein